jgi:hypothetical protein
MDGFYFNFKSQDKKNKNLLLLLLSLLKRNLFKTTKEFKTNLILTKIFYFF